MKEYIGKDIAIQLNLDLRDFEQVYDEFKCSNKVFFIDFGKKRKGKCGII